MIAGNTSKDARKQKYNAKESLIYKDSYECYRIIKQDSLEKVRG